MKINFFNIALADDDADDQLLFQMALKEVNRDICLNIYDNGLQLLDALKDPTEELPQVIFLDLNMPRKNGLECLEEMHKNERLKHIPVVILTTSLSPVQIQKAYERGAVMCACKPEEFSMLVNLIEEVFATDLSIPKMVML